MPDITAEKRPEQAAIQGTAAVRAAVRGEHR
jgi:hypothetical protein